jgi:signal transduction histidine kinase
MSDDADRPSELAFVDNLAHDLRNPLNTILMSTSLLARAKELSEPHHNTVVRMQRAAERLTDMIEHLADHLRHLHVGPQPPRRRPTNLHELCGQVLAELEPDHPGRLRLSTGGDGQGSWDIDRLKRVIYDLALNGLLHGTPGGEVVMEADDDGGAARLRVTSRGPVNPAVLPLLFDPIARAQLERPRGPKGLGLGLQLARLAVEAHGGTLTVESAADTTVTVRLPRSG